MCWIKCKKCNCERERSVSSDKILFDDNKEKILHYLHKMTEEEKEEYEIINNFGNFVLSKEQSTINIGGTVFPFFILLNKKTNEIKLIASKECFDP